MKARFVNDINVKDPDTGGSVNLSIYKHENGGMFAIDTSYIEQVLDEENPVILDPFVSVDEDQTTNFELYLVD